jgi:dihydrofolate reductase
MRVLIIAAITLDGYLSHCVSESSSWTSREDKLFFKKKTLVENNAVIIGRKTYETIPAGLPGRNLYVLTKSVGERKSVEGTVFFDGEVESLLRQLEKKRVTECWVAGGREIYSLFMRKKLVHELYVTIEPVVFGKGVPFFSELDSDRCLKLIEHYHINENSIGLHYIVLPEPRKENYGA